MPPRDPRLRVEPGGNGLNHHERISALEGKLYRQKDGVVEQLETLTRRVQVLESAQRRRELGWFARWFLRDTV